MAVLGGRKIKQTSGEYELVKNTPIHTVQNNENVTFWFHEHDKNTDERIFIKTAYSEMNYGFLGHECAKQYVDNSKAADLMCILVTDQSAYCRIYDVKKKIGGEDVITHLIAQWNTSMRYAVSLAEELECSIHKSIGVFTETYDKDMLKDDIDNFHTNRQKRYDKLNLNFIERKHRAQNDAKDLEALRRFLNKKEAFVHNEWLPIDIRIIQNGEYHITFDGSQILPEN